MYVKDEKECFRRDNKCVTSRESKLQRFTCWAYQTDVFLKLIDDRHLKTEKRQPPHNEKTHK